MKKLYLLISTLLLISTTTQATVSFNNPPELCTDEVPFSLTTFLNPNPTGGTWVCTNCDGFDPIGNDDVTFDAATKLIGYNYELRYYTIGKTDSGDITLKVNPLPNITISASDYNVCENISQITLNVSPAGPGGAWSGAGISGNIFIPSLAGVKKDQNNKLIYAYKDPVTGCQNKDSLEIYVQSAPIVIISVDKSIICEGDKFELTAISNNAPNGIQWSSTDGNVFNNMTPSTLNSIVNYTPDNDDRTRGSVTLTAETRDFSGNQCSADKDSVILNILEFPDAIIQPIDNGCEPHSTSVVATVRNTKTTANYLDFKWDFGDGITKTNADTIEFHTWGDPGNYTVTLIASNQGKCNDTATEDVDVYEKPNPNVIVIPANLTTTEFAPIFTVVNNTVGGDKPYTNVWSWGDNSPDDINPEDSNRRASHRYNPTNIPDTGNIYLISLTVTTAKGCTEKVQVTVRINPATNTPQVFPVPASEEITVIRKMEGTLHIALINRRGSVLREYDWAEDADSFTIQRENLPPGIYVILITDANGNSQKEKLIFE